MISTRYTRANNKSMGKDFDPNKPSIWIKGLDANNLYGWAMSQYLPYAGFQFLKEEEFANIDWQAQKDEQDIGYLVVADLQYPKELHDEHNDFPLAQERMFVKEECLK